MKKTVLPAGGDPRPRRPARGAGGGAGVPPRASLRGGQGWSTASSSSGCADWLQGRRHCRVPRPGQSPRASRHPRRDAVRQADGGLP